MPLLNIHVDVSSRAWGLILVLVYIYIHTLCMPAGKAVVSQHYSSVFPEALLLEMH